MTSAQPAKTRAFTLIELLIVVGIISILAAIAVPNFLEAQTRAKISRSVSDLRSIAVALEAYHTDNNGYPVVGNPALPSPLDSLTPFYVRLRRITTPVAYISSLPVDPFARIGEINGNGLFFTDETYSYAPGNLYFGAAPIYSGTEYRASIFSVAGRGPDRYIFFGNYCMAHPRAFEDGANIRGAYDPTNGTISEGDILRLGGSSLGRQTTP
ncbi:MAG: prepilin-type N-terminal cleavage/methylation domain-containing protein [Candidatus Sumerlaeaceae bacterium]|nr:prepilin-type N-terminal cleavage/methylation domain-containing protein [Candidatus Sumerlaeaceae bacterium]